MSRLLGQKLLWLLGRSQSWVGEQELWEKLDLLLKLFIPKCPDLCKNCIPFAAGDFLRGCIAGGGGSQSIGVLAGRQIYLMAQMEGWGDWTELPAVV